MRKRSEVQKGSTTGELLDSPRGSGAATVSPTSPDGVLTPDRPGAYVAEGEPPLFVDHGPKGPKMSTDFERILERLFDLPDALPQYERLERSLKLGDERTDVGSLQKALDEAEDNARVAHKLYANAKVEAEVFERDHELVEAPMWAKATAAIQDEKDRGTRNKAITDADVRAKAAELYPDQYRAHGERSAKVKLMVEHAKKLCELWTGRCTTLATLLANRRK